MSGLNDKQVESFIGHVLRGGVLISSFVTAVGLSLYLLHHATLVPNYHVFHLVDGRLRSLRQLIPDAFQGHPMAIIQLGVLLLIATPVARVACLVGAFAMERDQLYVAVSGAVLIILLCSLFFAR